MAKLKDLRDVVIAMDIGFDFFALRGSFNAEYHARAREIGELMNEEIDFIDPKITLETEMGPKASAKFAELLKWINSTNTHMLVLRPFLRKQ